MTQNNKVKTIPILFQKQHRDKYRVDQITTQAPNVSKVATQRLCYRALVPSGANK